VPSRPTRIAVIETSPYGGLLHYAAQLADALAERGHEVDLIVPRGNELIGHRGAARMRAVLTPSVRWTEQPKRGRLHILVRRAGVAIRLARSWIRILFEARRGRYNLALVNSDIDLALTASGALALTALPGGPSVVRINHNVRVFNRGGGQDMFKSPPLLNVVLRWLVPRFALVLMHGEQARREFNELWPNIRTAVIPHGDERIFADEPPPPSREERILFFGEWRKVKGLPALMEAFDELAARRPSVRLTIAGKPSPQDTDPESVKRWAARHGDRVKVIDRYVPLADVPAVFGEARVVVTPYVVGYQSGVVHLAMTMARAVVATDVGDLGSAVLDGVTGRVVPPGDTSALASALEEVTSDPELATRLGVEGRRQVFERSSWETVAEQADRAFAQILNQTKAGKVRRD
jgi:glycosyltransferase involved in cell wall biosynthesis